jgi:hypothetical protein
MRLRLALLAAVTLALTGCATAPKIDATPPRALVPELFFKGRSLAVGEFVNTIDGSRRGLTAIIDGSFDGQTLTLVEYFTFSDGEKDKKTWRLTKTGPTTYVGTREDVVGDAQGRLDGPFFRLTYGADVKAKGSVYTLTFDDVLALQSDGSALNRAVVSKWGLKVGEVTLKISPRSAKALQPLHAPRP